MTHLFDFGGNFIKLGPIVKRFVIGNEDFRWRGAGGVAQGRVCNVARVLVDCMGDNQLFIICAILSSVWSTKSSAVGCGERSWEALLFTFSVGES